MADSNGTIHVSKEIRRKIKDLYALVGELEEMFPGRPFTPDGHMVGSIGEIVAAAEYELELFEPSHPVHDAKTIDGKLVQIKATQGSKIAISECPEHLIALKLHNNGEFEEIYNGPGEPAWLATGKSQKTGQRFVSVAKLKELASEMEPSLRLLGKSDVSSQPATSFARELACIEREIEVRERMLPKYEGCLIGGAAGDALGYAVEFMDWDEIRARYGERGIQSYELDDCTGLAFVSDDTQMTLFTANGALIGNTRSALRGIGGGTAGYVMSTYRDWLLTQDPEYKGARHESWLLEVPELHHRRAPGNTCLSAIRNGMGSMENPCNNSKGCGGVMRVAPVGLSWRTDIWSFAGEILDACVHDAAETAARTHGHPLGYIPAGAFAYIVNRCAFDVPTGCVDPRGALAGIVHDCRRKLARWFPEHPHAAAYVSELLGKAAELSLSTDGEPDCIHSLGGGWVGEEALAIGVYAALRHADDFSEAIRCAVNHGGDSDSTGSICGNIVGALLGIDGIGGE